MTIGYDKFDLDLLGQQPGLHLYTQLCFCFVNPTSISDGAIIDTLEGGLKRLSNHAFWIAGDIMNDGSDHDSTGTYSISRTRRDLHLVVEDHRKTPTYSMAELRDRNFPASDLQEQLYASRMTSPPSTGSTAVFEVKANFINGGLILTIVGHHQVMDMMGQAFLIRLLSRACADQTITEDELQILNTARANSIPLLEGHALAEAERKLQSTTPEHTANIDEPLKPLPELPVQQPSRECSWVFFNFTSSALTVLKSEAASTITSGYISTDDAMTAVVWKYLSIARTGRIGSKAITKLGRAVDVRRYLERPKTYPGLMQYMSHHSRTISQIKEESLGSIASELRVAVDPKTAKLAEDVRLLATKIAQTKDRSKFNFTGAFDPSTSLMLSSWAGVECYDLGFGLGLGLPEMVRRPSFTNVEGLGYFMPKCPNGDIALLLCARIEDLEQLKSDQAFIKYATYIG